MARPVRLVDVALILMLVGWVLAPRVRAQEEPPPPRLPVKPGATTHAERVIPAQLLGDVDFVAEFGEKAAWLGALGRTVDRGRRYQEAVTLAMAGVLLHRAEVATSHQSQWVRAEALFGEAENLALEQRDAAAMHAVAQVLGDPSFGPGALERSRALEEKAASYAAVETFGPRVPPCDLTICNGTDHTVDIYVREAYVGTIGPRQERTTRVPRGLARLKGLGTYEGLRWGPATQQLKESFIWTLGA